MKSQLIDRNNWTECVSSEAMFMCKRPISFQSISFKFPVSSKDGIVAFGNPRTCSTPSSSRQNSAYRIQEAVKKYSSGKTTAVFRSVK